MNGRDVRTTCGSACAPEGLCVTRPRTHGPRGPGKTRCVAGYEAENVRLGQACTCVRACVCVCMRA